MPYILRTLSIRDVVHAVKRRKLRLALRISQCLASNGVNAVRFRLRRRPQRHAHRVMRSS